MLSIGLLVMVMVGCKKSTAPKGSGWEDPWAAKGAAQTPPGQKAASNSGGNPHAAVNPHAGMAMNPHGGAMGAAPGGGMPGQGQGQGVDVEALGLESPDPNRAIDPNKFLQGTIQPSQAMASKIPPAAVLFLSAKRKDPASNKGIGAPLAVAKYTANKWPVAFRLTEEDAMIKGTAFSGEVVISAWFDQDQDAMSKQSGDVLGSVVAKIPAKGLVLTLDTLRP